MGTVFLAVRDDDVFHKRVALKILKRGMDTDSIVRRFRTERQILAGLDHPNIARLIDGGTTADGLPYLVMEFVDGAPLAEYATTPRPRHRGPAAAVPAALRRRAVRAPEPGHPSRHQAGQRAGDDRRRAEAAGFRHRQAAERGPDRPDDGGGHPAGPAADDAGVREPGTGARRAGDHGHRRLFAGHPAVRAADGTDAVPHHQPRRAGDRSRGVRVGAAPAQRGGHSPGRTSCPRRGRRDHVRGRLAGPRACAIHSDCAASSKAISTTS